MTIRELAEMTKSASPLKRLQITVTWAGYNVYRVGYNGCYQFRGYTEPTLGFIDRPMTEEELIVWLKIKHKELEKERENDVT